MKDQNHQHLGDLEDQVQSLHDKFNLPLTFGWGMTETCALGAINRGDEYLAKPNSSGLNVPYLTLPPSLQFLLHSDHDHSPSQSSDFSSLYSKYLSTEKIIIKDTVASNMNTRIYSIKIFYL